jgi:lipoprotein-anchoring transpeptidase ErfK/SrfK
MKRAATVAGVSAAALICAWTATAVAAPASTQSPSGGFSFFRPRAAESPVKAPEKKSKSASDAKPSKAALHEADKTPPIPKGPLHVIVSIDKQRATLYADGHVVAQTRISSGTATHPTPLGVFSILQKNRHHVSNLYDAKMPYMQRITWSGAALHEGPLPGYPASHGCVRLPTEFAQFLWKVTKIGARVIITRDEPTPVAIEHERLFVATVRTEEPKPAPKIEPTPAPAPSVAPKAEPKLDIISEQKIAPSRDGEAIATRPVAMVKTADATGILRGPARPDVMVKPLAAGTAPSALAGEQPTKLPLHGDMDEMAMPRAPVTTAAGRVVERLAETVVVERAAPIGAMAKADLIKAEVIKTELVKQDRIEAPTVTVAAAAAPVTTAPAPVAAEPPPRKGTVSVFVSLKDSRLYVRQGMEPLFDAPVTIARPTEPIGTHVYTAMGSKPNGSGLRWTVVSIPSAYKPAPEPKSTNGSKKPRNDKPAVKAVELTPAPVLNPRAALDRIVMPPDAVERIASLVAPGASLIVSDNKLSGETGATTDFIVETR